MPGASSPASVARGTRVAIIVPSLRGGGLERLARDLALSIRERGYDPAVFCLNGLGIYADSLRSAGIEVRDCHEGSRRVRGLPLRLIRDLARFAPEIIHAHSGTWQPSSVAKAVLGRPRLVFTDHGRYPPEPWTRRVVERWWCYRHTDRYIAVTDALAEYVRDFLRLGAAPDVVYNGIDVSAYGGTHRSARARLRAEWGAADDDLVAVAVGRFVPVKNHAGLLRAAAAARRQGASIHLALVGTGVLEPEMRQLAHSLGIERHVRFLGFREDVADCLAASDLFVNASTTEALPVSLLEAMATGLPTLATAVGGVPEALGDPPAGILVPAADEVALAGGLTTLAGDPTLRQDLSVRAHARAGRYSLQEFTDGYCAVYASLLPGFRA